MKKFCLSLMLAGLLAALAACGSQNSITMQEVYDANRPAALLANHESVCARFTVDGEDVSLNYVSEEVTYDEVYGWACFMTDEVAYTCEDGTYHRMLPVNEEGLVDVADYRAAYDVRLLMDQTTTRETIESVTEQDGRLTVSTQLPAKYFLELTQGQEGVKVYRCEYMLDADTRVLIGGRSVCDFEDGTSFTVTSEMTYDEALPDQARAFLALEEQGAQLRTVTLVTNPGTQQEKIQSVQVAKGLSTRLDAGMAEGSLTAYADAACTLPYTASGDHDSDVTVYLKWSK